MKIYDKFATDMLLLNIKSEAQAEEDYNLAIDCLSRLLEIYPTEARTINLDIQKLREHVSDEKQHLLEDIEILKHYDYNIPTATD